MTIEQLKQQAAEAALQYIGDNMVVGVGSGSTVNHFIAALASIKHRIEGAIASSSATEQQLRQYQIPLLDLNACAEPDIYIDGADEINRHMQMIKGGGGALTREKIIAAAAKQFICIIDASKWVTALGNFPIALEVIPMARSYVGREMVKLGGNPNYRNGFMTDNSNIIIDVYNLNLNEPIKLETLLNNIVGVVCHGLFATTTADICLRATADGVSIHKKSW